MGTYYVEKGDEIVDGNTFCDGRKCTSADTIIIRGGARDGLLFHNFDGAGSYITITNENATSKVVITGAEPPGWGILSLLNCKYVDLRGNNDNSIEYGIKVINGASTHSGTIRVYGESDHIKIGYTELAFDGNTSNSGTGIRVQDDNLTNAWTFNNFEIHHNYIHGTRYAGMYLGHNISASPTGNPYLANFSVHDNLLVDMGSYGITFRGVKGANNYIYNNIVRTTGVVQTALDDSAKYGIGIQMFESGYMAEIYDNRVEHTVGPGIKICGVGHLVHHNEILGCGTGNKVNWGHGIVVDSWGGGSHDDELYDNIILQAYGYGIKELGDCTNIFYKRNLIGDCGLGEADGDGLVEGTGADANIYHANVADFGFRRWSDDGDYSNDDFTISEETPKQKTAHWTMDSADISGTTLHDVSGNNDGTIHGASQTPGMINEALAFNGDGDYVKVPHSSSIDFADEDFSVSVWFKTTTGSVHNYILSKNYGGAGVKWYGINILPGTPTIKCYVDDGTNNSKVNTTGSYNDGAWHHLVFVRDTTANKLIAYIDGGWNAEVADMSGSIANTGALTIGARADLGTGRFFDGAIDDPRIYNYALSLSEVAGLFKEAGETPPISHEVSIVVPVGAELRIDGKLVDTKTMTKLLEVLKDFIK